MSEQNGDRFPTYRQLVTWSLSIIGIMLTLSGLILGTVFAVVDSHSSRPHRDSVSIREMDEVRERLIRIEEKVDRVLLDE